MVDVFERKIQRRICGPIKDIDQWWCRFNRELDGLFKGTRLSAVIRIARLRWAGHVVRMEDSCMPRRLKDEGKWLDRALDGEMMWERMQGC
jgi:hypothetical protein